MNIASSMGVVKKEAPKRGVGVSAIDSGEMRGREQQSYGRGVVKEVNLISPLGIKLSSFIKLAESLNTTLKTHEVAVMYLKPPTGELFPFLSH